MPVGFAAHMTTGGESTSATNAISAKKAGRTNAKLRVSDVVNSMSDWDHVAKTSLTHHSHGVLPWLPTLLHLFISLGRVTASVCWMLPYLAVMSSIERV